MPSYSTGARAYVSSGIHARAGVPPTSKPGADTPGDLHPRPESPTNVVSTCQSCGSTMDPEAPRLSAGVTLRAADALRQGQELYTADQVAYLLHLAYESGRTAAAGEDLAEVVACWAEHPLPTITRAQRVAQRIAEMEAAARRWWAEQGREYREYRGGPVEWETGRPIGEMGVAA